MKLRFISSAIIVLLASVLFQINAEPQTTRKERNIFLAANEAFNDKDYQKAIELYNTVLEINPNNERAQYNLAVTMVKLADEIGGAGGSNMQSPDITSKSDSTSIRMKQNANEIFQSLYKSGAETKEQSIYNSGNIYFSQQDYPNSIEQYKKALRINPNNDNARHNLRVAQLRLKQQQNDKNDDNEQDDDKNKDNKDQENKQDEQQKQQDQQQQQQQQQPPKPQPQKNHENILNAVQQNELKTQKRKEEEKEKGTLNQRSHLKPW